MPLILFLNHNTTEGFLCRMPFHYTHSLPGSIQHTPIVVEYLMGRFVLKYKFIFIHKHEDFFLDFFLSLSLSSILNVLVLSLKDQAKIIGIQMRPTGSEPILLATCFCSFVIFAQFLGNCLKIDNVVRNDLIFIIFACDAILLGRATCLAGPACSICQ
jgi:hypothetical protein